MINASEVKLVIFDCDGVLVDSEPIGNRIFHALLQQYDVPLSLDEVERNFVGRSDEDCYRILTQDMGYKLPENFSQQFSDATKVAFTQELRAVDGIRDVLDRMSLPRCVASSGPVPKIHHSLALTGLNTYFEHVFSAQHVGVGKPAPDLFLHAASTLSIAPVHCLVIEDSVPGVQAAVSAGMQIVGYAPRDNGAALKAAGAQVIHGMPDVLKFMQ